MECVEYRANLTGVNQFFTASVTFTIKFERINVVQKCAANIFPEVTAEVALPAPYTPVNHFIRRTMINSRNNL